MNSDFLVRAIANFNEMVTENLFSKADEENKKRIRNMKYLYFKKGDFIKVINAHSHGWWFGKLINNYTDIFDEFDSKYQ